jgi:hypothetical protein
MRRRNWLGQKISKLILAGNKLHIESLLSYHILNKVEINFHMFSSSMKNRVGGEVSSTNIVTPKSWRGGQCWQGLCIWLQCSEWATVACLRQLQDMRLLPKKMQKLPVERRSSRLPAQFGPKLSKMRRRNWLGQKISKLILAGNKLHIESLLSYHILNKVEINFHMFSSSMKNRVGGEVSSTNIVTPKSWRGGQCWQGLCIWLQCWNGQE